MSVKLMSLVWDAFPGNGSELLCMLALADWANDDGGSLHPSMSAIAQKIRLSEKQARRIVRQFEADGWLTVVGNAHGGAPGTTKQFRINVAKLRAIDTAPIDVTPPAGVTPPMGVPYPSHRCPETAPTGGSQTTSEPPVNRQVVNPPYPPRRRDRNAAGAGFARFWEVWPSSPRKVAKTKCQEIWRSARLNAVADQIIAHLEAMKECEQWLSGFEPAPLTYLKQRRWEDGMPDRQGSYLPDEQAVIEAYNAILEPHGWPCAMEQPYLRDRAAAIRAFAGFGKKAGWIERYFGYLAEELAARPGLGFDWAIRRETYLRAREGNFADYHAPQAGVSPPVSKQAALEARNAEVAASWVPPELRGQPATVIGAPARHGAGPTRSGRRAPSPDSFHLKNYGRSGPI